MIASRRRVCVDGREQEDSDESRSGKPERDSAESYAACSSGMTATEKGLPLPPVFKEDGKLSVLDSSVHNVDRYTLKLYRINGRKNKRTF